MSKRLTGAGVLLVSAATLLYELALMRLFAVSEWYYYAFVSVSVALLGNAASGTLAALLSPASRRRLEGWAASGLPLGVLASYLVLNHVPFDSYQLAWDPRQLAYLFLDYLFLVLPFSMSGYLLVGALGIRPEGSHVRYAASLAGSAVGSVALMALLPALGAEGVVVAVAALGAAGGLLLHLAGSEARPVSRRRAWAVALVSWLACGALLALRPDWMTQRISPYKSLSQSLQAQGAQHIYQAWNGYSRVDVVSSPGLHAAAGLSLAFRGQLPEQLGLTVDAGDLSPLSRRGDRADEEYLSYLPGAIAYALRPGGDAMILTPRGGTEVALALHMGARSVVLVEDNALVVRAVRDVFGDYVGDLYRDARVRVRLESGRVALSRPGGPYDLVVLPLTRSFHPLAAGAYGLSEDYVYTVEGIGQALDRLEAHGLLAVTRWAQDPPAETVRAAALLVEALSQRGAQDPARHLLVYRSWSTVTLLASPSPLSDQDTAAARDRCAALGLDMVHYPGMPGDGTAGFLVAASARDQALVRELLATSDRAAFYRAQVYDVSPPTDDRPFFDHYFRWPQLPTVLKQLGRTWQPFGGSGYLLVLFLLCAIVALVGSLIAVALRARGAASAIPERTRAAAYFCLIGLAYMLVEMPLAQRYILYLGHPARAFAVVLATLLLASGLGSLAAHRVRARPVLGALALAAAGHYPLITWVARTTMSWPVALRCATAAASLVPLGFLMGMPFAVGLRRLGSALARSMPWVWAANGGASVVGSILATVLAIAIGFRAVLWLGAACYLGAGLCLWPPSREAACD